MTGPVRKRRRQQVSCALCRKRKLRCNRELPCSTCLRSRGGAEACVYDNQSAHSLSTAEGPSQVQISCASEEGLASGVERQQHQELLVATHSNRDSSTSHSLPSRSWATYSTKASTVASQPSPRDRPHPRGKAGRAEDPLTRENNHLAAAGLFPPAAEVNIETSTTDIGGTFHAHFTNSPEARSKGGSARCVAHKTRLFGQSHWITSIFLMHEILDTIEDQVRGPDSKLVTGMQKCKVLSRKIKSQREPAWPCPPRDDLPSKDIADELVDRYFQTNEIITRVLHIPSFERDYEALYTARSQHGGSFLVLLKLVFAIGAVTYDDDFSLRPSAIRWIFEAQTWLAQPGLKSRLNIQTLQITILLLLARECVEVGGDLTWISVGSLLRTAVSMGLHRDPSRLPKRSLFASEMRRRLWNTIMEMCVFTSLTSGGPPYLALSDFDAEPPANFDDEQLTDDDAIPQPEGTFTHSTIAIVLRRAFPVRLAITKFLNDIRSDCEYAEALRLDARLKSAYKQIREALQRCSSTSGGPSPTRIGLRIIDLLVHRHFLAVHVPFVGVALNDNAYAYSRITAVETTVKIWYTTNPAMVDPARHHRDALLPAEHDIFARLTTCGSKSIKTLLFQISFLVSSELRERLREETTLGPTPFIRSDLLAIVEGAKVWGERCIRAGETNVKGFLLLCVINASINGILEGLEHDKLCEKLIKAGEEAEEYVLPILEEMARRKVHVIGMPEAVTSEAMNEMSMDESPEIGKDWDLLMSCEMFQGGSDYLGWMFPNDTTQGLNMW